MEKRRRRIIGLVTPVILIVASWGTASLLVAQQSVRQLPRRGAAAVDAALGESEPAHRLREGSLLKSQTGTFKESGDRVMFQLADGGDSFHVLENLALERVWGTLASARGRLWNVSGLVTEYRGRNFLLLDRAVIRAQSANATVKP